MASSDESSNRYFQARKLRVFFFLCLVGVLGRLDCMISSLIPYGEFLSLTSLGNGETSQFHQLI